MKSYVAFIFNVQKLFDSGGKVYLWTFTFREAHPSWWVSQSWDRLRRDLWDFFGRFEGVRVAEMHRLHGVHYHVLVRKRLPVMVVRRLARRYGFGRIHVCDADIGSALYLGKYLTKEKSLPHGGRKWTAFGDFLEGKCRKSDIDVSSGVGDAVKKALACHPGASRSERFAIGRREYRRYYDGTSEFEERVPGVANGIPAEEVTITTS